MGMPGLPELTVILLIVVLLFGAKKIPELAKGLGSGIKNFKNAMKDDETQVAHTDEAKKINASEHSPATPASHTETTKA